MSAASPAEAEARGQEFIAATFSGTEFRLPLDVDAWPLDTIRACRGMRGDKIVVNHDALIGTLQTLLGAEQWHEFLTAAPKRRDHVPAANAFAAAAGFSKDPAFPDVDIVFGAIPRLLALIDMWPSKLESDLNRFWQLDYRDRWRFDDDGRRRLTLRQIYARVSNLPAGSALAIALGRRAPDELLLMDLFEGMTGRKHPARPISPAEAATRQQQAEAEQKARAGYRQRQAKRNTHLDNARANARRTQQRES